MRHTKRWKILRGRSQRKLKQQLIPCELMSPNFYKSYKLFELIPLSSFIALLKFTEMCAFQMRHNNVSQEGVLALTLSLSRRHCLSVGKHQTFPATKQQINSSLKTGACHHSQNRSALPAPRCTTNTRQANKSPLIQAHAWTEQFLGH